MKKPFFIKFRLFQHTRAPARAHTHTHTHIYISHNTITLGKGMNPIIVPPAMGCCIAMNNYTYTYTYRNIFNTINTSGHSSLEKYTSLFIERVVRERELETEQNCNILTPTIMAITAFLSRSAGLLSRKPGAQPLWDMVLIPASSLQLIWGSELQLFTWVSWGPPLLGAGSLYSISSPTNLNFLSPGLYNNL